MRILAEELADSSLLVLATARDADADRAAVEAFAADLGDALDTRLHLAPLTDDSAAQLLAELLGGAAIRPAFARLAARCDGNPLTLGVYLRAVIDAGLIRPSWGVWELEERGLDALVLPADALGLDSVAGEWLGHR